MMKFPSHIIFFFISILMSIHTVGHAEMRPVLKHRVGIPPFDVLQEILETNLSPSRDIRQNQPPMPNQAPHITWLADSDTRVEPHFILATPHGQIHSVRNLANQMVTSQGAIDYGILSLHSPILLITGNTDSEAITLFLSGYENLPPATRADLDHLVLPAREAVDKKEKEKLSLAEQVQMVVENNIDHQVDTAMERYQERIRDGRLVVMGAVLDLTNHYGKGVNRLLIININGERRDHFLQRLPLTNNLRPELKKSLGRKPTP